MKNVGFFQCNVWREFGYSETLYSWFSTICYRLENKKWGSRFPITMNHLYYDEENGIEYKNLKKFEKEIKEIKKEFLKLKLEDAIWSFEDNILKIPSNMPNINYEANTLVDVYVNNYNKNIFLILQHEIEGMRFYKEKNKCEPKLVIREENNI